MKIAIYGLPNFKLGKHTMEDERVDQVAEIYKSKKIVYLALEFVSQDDIKNAEALLSAEASKVDLVLSDLDYVADRLTKEIPPQEKELFTKAQAILEKEDFLSKSLSAEELKILKGYPLFTTLPVIFAKDQNADDLSDYFKDLYYATGRICFLTGGEKEARAWSIHNGDTAWHAAGAIHSEIQQGFVRAEVVAFNDLVEAGHFNEAKNRGKVRLEPKEYVVKDADVMLFRSNK